MFVCSYLGINCQSTAFFIYFKIYTFDGKVYVIEFRLRSESMFYVCVIVGQSRCFMFVSSSVRVDVLCLCHRRAHAHPAYVWKPWLME